MGGAETPRPARGTIGDHRRCIVLAAVLLVPGCDAGTPSAPAPAELAAAGGGQQAPAPAGTGPDPLPTVRTEIVRDETISVRGRPACVFTIRHPGDAEQDVTWSGEPCDAVNAAVVLPQQLQEGGQLADLPQEARRDIERMTGGVFVVEGQSAAAAYPMNAAGRIYEVDYAD